MAPSENKKPDDDDGLLGALRRETGYVTWALLGLNVSVYIAMVLAGAGALAPSPVDVVAAGGVDPVLVWSGDVWRLLTACFVHWGIIHLVLNMWALLQVGRALEEMIGGPRLALIYLSSGVFGFAVSLTVSTTTSTGASGAIFGLTGALLALALLVRKRKLGRLLFSALMPFVLLTFAIGFVLRMFPGFPLQLDNTAHFGGLVFGFLLTLGLSAGDRSFLGEEDAGASDIIVKPVERVLGSVALLVAGVVFAVVVAYGAHPALSTRYHAIMGIDALQQQQRRIDDAKAHAAAATRLNENAAATAFVNGRLKGDAGDVAGERALLREGLRRLHEDDNAVMLARAEQLLALGGGDEVLPFSDTRTVNALCDAALDEVGAGASPLVKNECAWVKLKSPDPKVHDAKRGLELARQAVKECDEKSDDYPTIVQTLSEALSQNGQAAEGLAILEKLVAEDRAGDIKVAGGGEAFIESERKRLKKIAEAEERVGSPPGTPDGDRR